MITAFGQGALAGLAVALPIGAIATLIVLWSARHGWRVGAAAGLGAGVVDGIYATVALLLGAVLSPWIEAWRVPLRWTSTIVLLAMGALIIASGWRESRTAAGPERRLHPAAAFASVLGLTLVNPTTVVYFTALVAGGNLTTSDPRDQVAFAVGALLASSAWQLALASVGAVAGARITGPGLRRWTALLGGLLVVGLAVATFLR